MAGSHQTRNAAGEQQPEAPAGTPPAVSLPQPPPGSRPTSDAASPPHRQQHRDLQQFEAYGHPEDGQQHALEEQTDQQFGGQQDQDLLFTHGSGQPHNVATSPKAEVDFKRIERNKDQRLKGLQETLKMVRVLINLAEEEEERIKAKNVIDNIKLDHIYDVKERLSNIESQIVTDSENIDIDTLDQNLDAVIHRYGWAAEITRRGYFAATSIHHLAKLSKTLDKVMTIAEPEDELKQVLKAIEAYTDAEYQRVDATKDYMPWTTTNKDNKKMYLEDAGNLAKRLYASLSTNKFKSSDEDDAFMEDITRDGIRKKTQDLLSEMQQELQAKRHAWFDFCIRVLTLGFFRSESTTLQNLKKIEESLRKDMLLSSNSTRLNIASEINLAETQQTMENVKQSLGVNDSQTPSAHSSPYAQQPRSVSFATETESKHGARVNGTSFGTAHAALSAVSPTGQPSALKKKAELAATDPVVTTSRELSGVWNKLTKKVSLAASAHTRHFVVSRDTKDAIGSKDAIGIEEKITINSTESFIRNVPVRKRP